MAAWFESNIQGCAARFCAGTLERDDFRVVSAGKTMIAAADHLSGAHEHRPDRWIGAGSARRLFCQAAGHAKVKFVLRAHA